jgi:hypothetical protein
MLLEGPPYSNTGELGRREETSAKDSGGGGDPDGADSGVLVLLGGVLPPVEGEYSHLMPLLSFIVGKQRARERNPKQEEDKKKKCEIVPSRE